MKEKYRILRDNKERGPLTLEELLDLKLKPLDLVWVEGKSAGWRYPTEIDQLKSYMEGNPPSSVSLSQIHPASQQARKPASAAPAPVHPVGYDLQEDAPAGEETLTAEKLEMKAAEIYRRVQAYAEQKEEQEQGVQTKYAKSLDDLKQEYADWLHHKKSRKKLVMAAPGKKTVMIAAGVLLLVVTAWFLLPAKKGNDLLQRPTQSLVSNAAFDAPQEKESSDPVTPQEIKVTDGPSGRLNSSPASSVDAFIDSVERVLSSSASSHAVHYPKQSSPAHSAPLKADSTQRLQEPASITSVQPAPANTAVLPNVNMNARYEHEANRKNITSLEVTIQNNGVALIRTVAVDVFYYKKGNRLFDRETIYFNNIPPGNSMTVSRPGNKKAVHARFELGQVIAAN